MTIKELKSALLKKGWAGKTISRDETAVRLNALIQSNVELNHAYSSLLPRLSSEDESQQLQSILKVLRLDVGKLMELVFSCGATAFNGTSLEPESFKLDSDDPLTDLRNREHAFQELLEAERPIEHQIRTEAVLSRLRETSESRLSFLRLCKKKAILIA